MDEKWLEICLETEAGALEELTAQLTARDVTGLVIEDEQDFKTFLAQNHQYWDYVDDGLLERMKGAARVKFYEPDTFQGRARLKAVTEGLGGVTVSVTELREEDWANGWKKYYKPMPVGRRLYVMPEWERGEIPGGRTALILNPGLTFGTGSHASTQLCLEGLEGLVNPGDRILDLGCGSGILSIAALALGASDAMGVDIDPKAVDVAYENAALNGIGRDRYQVRAGDVLSDGALAAEIERGRYELVLANIVADVIIPLSVKACQWLAPGGSFLCSGIIAQRAEEVKSALEAHGLVVTDSREKSGWVAYTAVAR